MVLKTSKTTARVHGPLQELDSLFGMTNSATVSEAAHHIPLNGEHHLQEAEGTSTETPNTLSHVDATGRASMVDISNVRPPHTLTAPSLPHAAQKPVTTRSATASAVVHLGPHAFKLVAANQVAKGDVLTVAQLAGIMGAKHTSLLIPLCHPLSLSSVDVRLSLNPQRDCVQVLATAKTDGKTGVEMEALTAAGVAALTVYDMCKAANKDIVISNLRLEHKVGGRGGEYVCGGESPHLAH